MQRYAISIECTDWDKHKIDAEPDEFGDWVKYTDVADLVNTSLKLQEERDHWIKNSAEQNKGWNKEHEIVVQLKIALKPFANYACDPPCGCHNCIAKAALEI